ncbi:MAG: hypothetical protein ACAH07_06010 [Methylophilaceae bacterium]|nr:hypothetical protein [Methyloradius sp.]
MSTKPELIQTAIFNKLSAAPPLAGVIWRSRLRPIPENKASAIVMRPGTVGEPDLIVLGQYRWVLNLAIEFYGRGDVPDSITDPIIEAAFTRIAADRTLGGICDDILPGRREWDFESRDTDLVVAILELNIEFTTSEATL